MLGFSGWRARATGSLSRMIYGLEARDCGEVFFMGEKIEKLTPGAMAARRVSYLNNNRKKAGLLMDSRRWTIFPCPFLKELTQGPFLSTRR